MIYFYSHRPNKPYWQFSQWADLGFTAQGIYYNCAEQYMMAQKALLFDDKVTYDKIMNTNDPKIQKSLGRGVSGFDPVIWGANAQTIVFNGNYAKFFEPKNQEALLVLIGTKGHKIVEASPYDTVWGIGISVADAEAGKPWQGKNWLGEAIERVRDFYFSQQETLSFS